VSTTEVPRCYFNTSRCAGPIRSYVMGGGKVRHGCDFHCAGIYPPLVDRDPEN
jgi:hypothetical protein